MNRAGLPRLGHPASIPREKVGRNNDAFRLLRAGAVLLCWHRMEQNWQEQITAALDDFLKVAQLSGEPIAAPVWTLDFRPAPHRSSGLPAGMMAIYAFWGDGAWLKIGKVGANSDARFRSQHYLPGSARSTLAGSILADTDLSIRCAVDPAACGDWIRTNTHRCNVLLPATYPKSLLSLLEAFLHHRLKPRYEG